MFKALRNLPARNNISDYDYQTLFSEFGKEYLKLEVYLKKVQVAEYLGKLDELFEPLEKFLNSESSFISLNAGFNLSYLYITVGKYPAAERLIKAGLEKVKKDQNLKDFLVLFRGNLSLYHYYLGNYRLAKDCVEENLKVLKEKDNPNLKFMNLNRLAIVYRHLGEYKKAREIYQSLLKYYRSKKYIRKKAIVLNNISNIPPPTVSIEESLRLKKKAYLYFKKVGERMGEALYFSGLSGHYEKNNQFEKSIQMLKKSIEIYRDLNNYAGLFIAGYNLINNHIQIGDFRTAEKLVSQVREEQVLNEYDAFELDILQNYLSFSTNPENFNPAEMLKLRKTARKNKWDSVYNRINFMLLDYYYLQKNVFETEKILAAIDDDVEAKLQYLFLLGVLIESPRVFSGTFQDKYRAEKSKKDVFFQFCCLEYFYKFDKIKFSFHRKQFKNLYNQIINNLKTEKFKKTFQNLWYIKKSMQLIN